MVTVQEVRQAAPATEFVPAVTAEVMAVCKEIENLHQLLTIEPLTVSRSQKGRWSNLVRLYDTACELVQETEITGTAEALEIAKVMGGRVIIQKVSKEQEVIASTTEPGPRDLYYDLRRHTEFLRTSPLRMKIGNPSQQEALSITQLADIDFQASIGLFLDFLMQVYLMDSFQLQTDMLKFNRDSMSNRYPNLAVYQISQAANYVRALFHIKENDLRTKVGQSKGIEEKAYGEALGVHVKLHRAQAALEKAVTAPPDSDIFKRFRPAIEHYLNEDQTVRSILIELLGNNTASTLIRIYSHCIDQILGNSEEKAFYEKLAQAIRDFVKTRQNELKVIMPDDIGSIYEHDEDDTIVTCHDLQKVVKPVSKFGKEADGYNIDPSSINWHGLVPAHYATVYINQDAPNTVSIELGYTINGQAFVLYLSADTNNNNILWTVFGVPKESELMKNFYRSLLRVLESGLKEAVKQIITAHPEVGQTAQKPAPRTAPQPREPRQKPQVRITSPVIHTINGNGNNGKEAVKRNPNKANEYQIGLLKQAPQGGYVDIPPMADIHTYIEKVAARMARNPSFVGDLKEAIVRLKTDPFNNGTKKLTNMRVTVDGREYPLREFAPSRLESAEYTNRRELRRIRIVYFVVDNNGNHGNGNGNGNDSKKRTIVIEGVYHHNEFDRKFTS